MVLHVSLLGRQVGLCSSAVQYVYQTCLGYLYTQGSFALAAPVHLQARREVGETELKWDWLAALVSTSDGPCSLQEMLEVEARVRALRAQVRHSSHAS